MAARAAPSVKRLLKEAKQLNDQYDKNGDIQAAPLGDGDNLFDWHFTIRGPSDSPFEDGIYHGRLLFPPQYPMKPPEIFLLTPNGRFETNKKICLSISGYHPETWLPSWSISTALRALQAFFCTPSKGAIGGLEWPEPERRRIAKKSPDWKCSHCDCTMQEILTLRENIEASKHIEPPTPAPGDENNNPLQPDKSSANDSSEAHLQNASSADMQQSTDKPRIRVDSDSLAVSARAQERRRIEQTMLKQQLEFQRSDMKSVIFIAFLMIVVVMLAMRKMSNVEESLS